MFTVSQHAAPINFLESPAVFLEADFLRFLRFVIFVIDIHYSIFLLSTPFQVSLQAFHLTTTLCDQNIYVWFEEWNYLDWFALATLHAVCDI